MKNGKRIISLLMTALMVVSLILGMASCGGNDTYIFTTGGPQGTYYGFTQAVATKLSEHIANTTFTAVTSGGSKANIEALADGDAHFAIVQNDVMINAYNGVSNFTGNQIQSFSVIGAVYPEVCQIIAREGITSVEDLRGKRVSIGAQGSGVVTNATQILEKHGISLEDITVSNLDSGASADALKEGKIDAFFFTGGVPTPAMQQLATSTAITFVSLADDKIAALKEESPFYVEVAVTHDVYDFIPEGTTAKAVAVTATYIVSNNVDEDVAYQVTKTLWEKQAEIAAVHNTGKSMNIRTALLGMDNVPVNAGAKRYYEEYLAAYNQENGTSLTFDAFYYNK
ncbi:MAG: TAXI family TRAP transporter solute-binding subunit [Clostridia bacterium]|nr:TAXI family TRAP transporter solute-binding subunit [Clostridia bacterium]